MKKQKLTQLQKKVLIEKGTEKPFTGKFVEHKEKGAYTCAQCGAKLFKSDVKFDSGTGWPSFSDAIPGSVKLSKDFSMGLPRTEFTCAKCGGHLGHVFNDAPQTPTGKRYCINSCSLDFKKKGNSKKKA